MIGMITSEDYLTALNVYIRNKDENEVRAVFKNHPEVEALLGYCRGDHGRNPIGIPSTTTLQNYSVPENAEYWPAVWDLHRHKKKWNDKSLGELDKSTSRIMSHLITPPHRASWGHYGLVVGYVQSGKTSNYTSLCAKAADQGYNLIIILSGLFNDLRSQTQFRLLKELAGTERDYRDGVHVLGDSFKRQWKTVTTMEKDFHNLSHLQPFSDPDTPHLIVTKKIVKPLLELTKWIENTPIDVKSKIKALIIDDEADHGSIDTQTGELYDLESKQFQRSESATNRNLRLLLKSLKPGFAYVGYTATPMANIFINPNIDDETLLGPSLYPNDFIISLDEPDGYSGINQIHSEIENSPYLIQVPIAEATILREVADNEQMMDKTPLPESLRVAMMQFIITWAIRRLRGQNTKHHSMLIHVKHTLESMTPLVRKVRATFDHWESLLSDAYEEEAEEMRIEMKMVWDSTYKHSLDTKFDPPSWQQVLQECKTFMSHHRPDIVEINHESKDTLDYDINYKNGWRALVIGGTRLSRGLTLEGLCISYFVRHAGAHDTLLQMGRWFGFRQGYEDLVRVHTTGPIMIDFMDMVEIERELRGDIIEYEHHGLSPVDFGVRVMKHMNNLRPTGKLKMEDVELRSHNEDSKIFETPTLALDNSEKLKINLEAYDEFITGLLENSSGIICGSRGKNTMWRQVTPKRVIDFLAKVDFRESQNRMPIEQRILPYIRKRLEQTSNELSNWNVVCVGSNKSNYTRTINRGKHSVTLNSVIRTRIIDSHPPRVGASIAGPWDYIADLVEEPYSFLKGDFGNSKGAFDRASMFKIRSKDEPLLLLYIIDPNSTPVIGERSSNRESLFKDDASKVPVIGMAIVLPRADISQEERNTEREYYIRLGAASLEDLIKSRRDFHE